MHNTIKFIRVCLMWTGGLLLLALSILLPVTPSISRAAAPVGGAGENSLQIIDPANRPNLAGDPIWQDVDELALRDETSVRLIIPSVYRLVAADIAALDSTLAQAPLENTEAARSTATILTLPLPGGGLGRFQIEESPVMAPELAAKYPEIKTYRGWGLDDPTATARLDRTPAGFHGLILAEGGTVYIDPYRRDDIVHYISYYKRDYQNIWGKTRQEGGVFPNPDYRPAERPGQGQLSGLASSGPTLRTYRLALAATGEYTAFHGGTVPGALAAMTTTMNRINGIYEREVSVRMTLIANNADIIYTDAGSDPYTNNNGSAMLGENQTTLTNVIGAANYDIGHVFSTGGGGVATLYSPCNDALKARGVTGSGAPVGDAFDVDYVAHEMGHQFGANHTFNANASGSCSGGNRNAGTAYEPGSGSTIMAYAGICVPQNLQSNSDDYFHGISFDEITAFITDAGPFGGDTCAAKTATGNSAPSVEAGPNYNIPRQTPFTLSGAATDPNGDALTYHWEEFDLGNPPANEAGGLPNTDSDGNARPIFRSYDPATGPARTFPVLSSILNGTNANSGESLPAISRNMSFRLTARDNKGGVNSDSLTVNVTNTAGPFAVTAPNTAITWTGLNQETVTWDVANTTAAPVSCTNVNLLLSTDGGNTFPLTLAANTPNDGTETVLAPPNIGSTTARVKVACADNIFFDISNTNFTLTEVAGAVLAITKSVEPAGVELAPGDPITFTIVVANSGGADAANVRVIDTLPAGVNGTDLDATTTVTANQSVTFTIKGTVALDAPTNTPITNTAGYSYTFGASQASASFTVISSPGSSKVYLPVLLK